MYARVSTVETSPAKVDTATHFFRQQVLAQLQQMDGFKGFIVLGDRQRGKLLGVALWESEEAMHSTEEVVSGIRGGIPHPLGGAAAGEEENYEVFIFEVSSERESQLFLRVGQVAPVPSTMLYSPRIREEFFSETSFRH